MTEKKMIKILLVVFFCVCTNNSFWIKFYPSLVNYLFDYLPVITIHNLYRIKKAIIIIKGRQIAKMWFGFILLSNIWSMYKRTMKEGYDIYYAWFVFDKRSVQLEGRICLNYEYYINHFVYIIGNINRLLSFWYNDMRT
jgi:hypothetical protein